VPDLELEAKALTQMSPPSPGARHGRS
jgi:hypothetical protein